MIEGLTVDYDRVESSTATVDGDRIVITLATGQDSTSISLPAAEATRIILAISTAAGLAKAARGPSTTAPTLPVENIRPCPSQSSDRVQFVVQPRGGAEMVFDTSRSAAAEFIHDWIEALRLEQSARPNRA